MDKYEVMVTFTEPLLGTAPLDKDLYTRWVAENEAVTDEMLAEELETIPTVVERGMTGFHKDEEGRPFLYDYVVKGYLKDACGMIRRVPSSESAKLKAYRKVIDGLVHVMPRCILLHLPDGAELGTLERPLRASTAQGERIALACSEMAPAGTTMEFTLYVWAPDVKVGTVAEWLKYGEWRGFGQWRNASYGRFTCEVALL